MVPSVAGVPERLPVELLVGVEPAATDPGPRAVLPAGVLTEPTGAARPVVGGGSFNVAGTLDGSGRYTDTLQRSEFVFYRVWLDWGQALAYRVRFGETPGRGTDNISPLSTLLYTPTRKRIEQESKAYTGSETVLPGTGDAVTTVGVRYANRDADVVGVRPQSVAGWYTIAVQVGAVSGGAPAAAVPIELDVAVTGTPEPGPRFDGPADPSTAEGTPSPSPVPAGASDGETATTGAAITWAGLVVIAAGVALLVVVGVLALRLARRRQG